MFGNNLPPADAVNGLRTMLEIMQLAADSKKAKAVIDQIAEAHTAIAAKAAEIESREKAVVVLEAKADKAVEKAEAATNAAITEQSNAASMKAALRADEEQLNARKAELDAKANALAVREVELDKANQDVQKRLERGLEELSLKSAALDAKIAEAEKSRADLAAKELELKEKADGLREKLKALTE